MKDFFAGIRYCGNGIAEFCRHTVLWKYAIIPLAAMLLIYWLLFYFTFTLFLPQSMEAIAEFFTGHWYEFIYNVLKYLIYISTTLLLISLAGFFAGNLFEILGAVFFSRMVRCYETEILGKAITPPGFAGDIANMFSCILFSVGTLFLYLIFFIAGLFIPVIPHILAVFFIGKRYAVIYTSEAHFNSGGKLCSIDNAFQNRSGSLYGFGAMIFLIFLIPFLPVFLIPGLVIGGTAMYHQKNF